MKAMGGKSTKSDQELFKNMNLNNADVCHQRPRPERWTAPCSRTKNHRQTSSRWMTASRWKRVTWGTFPRLYLKQEITRNTGQSKPCSKKDWLGSKSLSKANKDGTFVWIQ